ncbi:cyanate lyase C-terminal domain-containing protein [Desarmillaria ectypa]|nr:cyanate lyase C-terminal domain-containing protein [Desarmillaria ectypa]
MAQAATVPANNSPYADLPPINSKLFEAKAKKGLTFDQIAQAIGKDEVWLAAAFYGQAKFTPEELQKVAETLEIPRSDLVGGLGNHWWPNRGLGPMPPTDPVIYRLYESVLVYGHAIKVRCLAQLCDFPLTADELKAIIHEKFGDGIMSMIDCKINIAKKPDPKGDRVVLTFDGKFLPYAKW